MKSRIKLISYICLFCSTNCFGMEERKTLIKSLIDSIELAPNTYEKRRVLSSYLTTNRLTTLIPFDRIPKQPDSMINFVPAVIDLLLSQRSLPIHKGQDGFGGGGGNVGGGGGGDGGRPSAIFVADGTGFGDRNGGVTPNSAATTPNGATPNPSVTPSSAVQLLAPPPFVRVGRPLGDAAGGAPGTVFSVSQPSVIADPDVGGTEINAESPGSALTTPNSNSTQSNSPSSIAPPTAAAFFPSAPSQGREPILENANTSAPQAQQEALGPQQPDPALRETTQKEQEEASQGDASQTQQEAHAQREAEQKRAQEEELLKHQEEEAQQEKLRKQHEEEALREELQKKREEDARREKLQKQQEDEAREQAFQKHQDGEESNPNEKRPPSTFAKILAGQPMDQIPESTLKNYLKGTDTPSDYEVQEALQSPVNLHSEPTSADLQKKKATEAILIGSIHQLQTSLHHRIPTPLCRAYQEVVAFVLGALLGSDATLEDLNNQVISFMKARCWTAALLPGDNTLWTYYTKVFLPNFGNNMKSSKALADTYYTSAGYYGRKNRQILTKGIDTFLMFHLAKDTRPVLRTLVMFLFSLLEYGSYTEAGKLLGETRGLTEGPAFVPLSRSQTIAFKIIHHILYTLAHDRSFSEPGSPGAVLVPTPAGDSLGNAPDAPDPDSGPAPLPVNLGSLVSLLHTTKQKNRSSATAWTNDVGSNVAGHPTSQPTLLNLADTINLLVPIVAELTRSYSSVPYYPSGSTRHHPTSIAGVDPTQTPLSSSAFLPQLGYGKTSAFPVLRGSNVFGKTSLPTFSSSSVVPSDSGPSRTGRNRLPYPPRPRVTSLVTYMTRLNAPDADWEAVDRGTAEERANKGTEYTSMRWNVSEQRWELTD